MMLPFFENLVQGIEKTLAEQPERATARKRFALEVARLGVRLFGGKEPVAWCGVLVPFDLLNAMGVASCYVEFVGATLAGTGMVGDFLDEAEQEGFSTDGCSYHRSVMGAANRGMMPEPDFLIASSCPCAGGQAVLENLAARFDKDLFMIHCPQGGPDDPDAVQYLADQFRSMVDFVSGQTGRSLDPVALRAAVERTNRARELALKVYELTRNVPSPARRNDMVNVGIVMPLFMGTEGAVEVADAYVKEFTEKLAAGAVNPEREKIRLLWLQNRIQFKNPLIKILDEQHRAAVVSDELNDINWDPLDPDDPYRSLARRALSIPLTGTVQRRVENLKRLARMYRVDGVINPTHWGCRQGTGARGLIQEGMKEMNVPVLNLEVDCVDPRNFSEGQLLTRVEAFVEMIQQRKQGRPQA